MRTFLLNLLFPSSCLGCRREGELLCQDCRETLDISEHRYCLCNRNPVRLPPESQLGTCGSCKGSSLSGLYSALSYREKSLTRQLIGRLKYSPYLRQLAKPLAGIIIEHLVRTGQNQDPMWQNSVLVPVPLAKSRQKQRGYNQAEEIGKHLQPILQIPLVTNNLVKIKDTKPQAKLNAEQRAENLRDAFAVKNPAVFAGKKVFLIDDVYTTGATMHSCAAALKAAGAKQVWGISVAREG